MHSSGEQKKEQKERYRAPGTPALSPISVIYTINASKGSDPYIQPYRYLLSI